MDLQIANDRLGFRNTRKTQSRLRLVNFLKICGFCFGVLVAIMTRNAFLSFLPFGAILLRDRKFLLSVLLFTPLIETVLLAMEGVTITRLIALFVAVILISEMVLENSFYLDKKNICLFFFALVALFGSLNAVLTGEYFISSRWQGNVLRDYLVSPFSKIFFTIVLYSYFKNRGAVFLRKSLENASIALSVGIIMVSIYFITSGHETTSWHQTVTRMTFFGANPNDFSKILIALGAFPLYLVLTGKTKFQTLLGFSSFLFVSYSVVLTLSRGGIATLAVLFLISILVFLKQDPKRAIAVTIVFLAVLIGASLVGAFDLTFVYERFFGRHVKDISSITANRSDFLVSGLKAFFEKPILGHGGSSFTSKWINQLAVGQWNVMHNIFLEILVQYGIIGGLSFFMILFSAFKGFFKMRKYVDAVPQSTVFVIPYLSLLAILFAGLAASWEWREIFWYFIGIALVTSSIVGNNYYAKGV